MLHQFADSFECVKMHGPTNSKFKNTERITVCNKHFKIIHYHALMIHYEKQNKVTQVSLLQYKQRSLLHVTATYCDHLQGGVL